MNMLFNGVLYVDGLSFTVEKRTIDNTDKYCIITRNNGGVELKVSKFSTEDNAKNKLTALKTAFAAQDLDTLLADE